MLIQKNDFSPSDIRGVGLASPNAGYQLKTAPENGSATRLGSTVYALASLFRSAATATKTISNSCAFPQIKNLHAKKCYAK